MLTAEAQGFWKRNYEVYHDAGPTIAVKIGWVGQGAFFSIDGVEFEIRREGMFSRHYTLRALDEVQAEAYRPSVFRGRFVIEAGEVDYSFEPCSPFGRSFELWDQGQVVGEVYPEGIFSRSVHGDLPEELPLPVRVFLLALVIMIGRNRRAGAST
jgi:hypothetical protein